MNQSTTKNTKPPKVKQSFGRKRSEELGAAYASSLSREQLLDRSMRMAEISLHPLFVPPPTSVEESYEFGWMRGMAFLLETYLYGRWHAWLNVIERGEWQEGDVPKNPVVATPSKGSDARKMLDACMRVIRGRGYDYRDLIEWIGYGLGIGYFEKPRIPEELWASLYQEFSLDLLFLEKTDVFSEFIAEEGSSGHLDYYPTPLHITMLMNNLVVTKENDSLVEPCIGAAAMVLPSPSLNIVGVDLSPFMVKVASIHAFLFLPSLLYTPRPILGLHIDQETSTINRYFEFDTDTRIYCGDSLLGELHAPANIFEESSEYKDIYLFPHDLRLRDVFKYEEETYKPWDSLPYETRIAIVKAYAREVPMQIGMTNPPFDVKLGKAAKEYMKELDKTNAAFLAERERNLERWKVEAKTSHDLEVMEFEFFSYHQMDHKAERTAQRSDLERNVLID